MEKKKECKYPIFAERIKKQAKEKGFTQERLAEKVNCSLPTIKKWYVGDACPDVYTLVELSKILDCNVGYLTGETDHKTYDNKFICENTGLLEKVVDYIRSLNKSAPEKYFYINDKDGLSDPYVISKINILNAILMHDSLMDKIINAAGDMFTAYSDYKAVPEDDTPQHRQDKKTARALRYEARENALRAFGDILDDIFPIE